MLVQQQTRVRPLHVDDLDPLLALFCAVAEERRWIATEPGFDVALYRDRWLAQINGSHGAGFAALIDRELVGYLGVYPHTEYGYILGMLVAERYRARGIGKKLLYASLRWARRRGLRSLSLFVFPHNTSAIEMYRRAGFEERAYYEHDVPRHNGEVWDSILMTKML